MPKKGKDREQFTLALLDKFKVKLHTAKEKEQSKTEEAAAEAATADVAVEDDEESW